ncbi:MAG: hypothetical protein J6K91_01030, partial [Opitutales bacterium]|nr:hypothetical protein [Opitutales bacterium]
CSMAITKNVAHFYNRISGEWHLRFQSMFYGAKYDESQVPTLLKNTPLKKLKRKLSNALESFL